jgi:uncharacterized protein YktA (UPF0223 family)
MADNKTFKKFEEITPAKLEKKTISELSDRPNKVSAFGEVGLAAQDLKKRFDEFPEVVKDKINEIVGALNSTEATKYITLPNINMGASLYEFLSYFTGDVSKAIDDKICASYASPHAGKDKAPIDTLQNILTQIEGDFSIVEGDNDDNARKIADLESVGSLNKDLSALYERVKTLEASYPLYEDAIETLEKRIANLEKA